jgi:hypothetical protein
MCNLERNKVVYKKKYGLHFVFKMFIIVWWEEMGQHALQGSAVSTATAMCDHPSHSGNRACGLIFPVDW